MGDYTPVTWDTSGNTTAGTLTAAQATELSAQIAEEQLRNHVQSERWDRLVAGMYTMPRWMINSNVALTTSGNLNLTYFTCDQNATWANIGVRTGSTAAGATPTLVRWGLYSEAGNGDLTLVASIASDTTLFAAASGTYSKTITTPIAVTKGQRYASAWIVVSAAAIPSLVGGGFNAGAETMVAPRLAVVIAGQTDLPSSITNATIAAGTPAACIATRMF